MFVHILICIFFLMFRLPPRSTRTYPLFPASTILRYPPHRFLGLGERRGMVLGDARRAVGRRRSVVGGHAAPDDRGQRRQARLRLSRNPAVDPDIALEDRKSTRLNSSR